MYQNSIENTIIKHEQLNYNSLLIFAQYVGICKIKINYSYMVFVHFRD